MGAEQPKGRSTNVELGLLGASRLFAHGGRSVGVRYVPDQFPIPSRMFDSIGG
ncbi:hypothetical protein MycrhDRAFT_1158 [Mycolicibacterium rhodesiae JS60]|nr:hypothetical protein MycrhDRAFT_1158 [Mycolicibacterium rhodesiae JS60]